MESKFYLQSKVPSNLYRWWVHFRSNKLSFSALIVYGIIATFAIFADFIAPYDPTFQFINAVDLPPYWDDEGRSEFIFGTDYIGRDIFSRLVHGAQLTLFLAAAVVTLSGTIGIILGVIAGFTLYGLDALIMRLMHFILAIPSLILAVIIVAIIGPGLPNAIYAVALVLIPNFVLITKTEIEKEINKDYVTAMMLDGASKFRLFFQSILPNIFPPIVIQLTFAFSTAILEIATLGFLGLGAQSPSPEWGAILSESHHNIMFSPWSVELPGLAIFFTLLSVNLLGDGLRDAIDSEKK